MTTVPKYYEFMNPLLQALHKLGGRASTDEMRSAVKTSMSLSQEQATVLLRPGERTLTILDSRLGWARTYLKKYGLIDNPEHGVWILTEEGKQTKRVDPDDVVATVQAMDSSQRRKRNRTTRRKSGTKQAPAQIDKGDLRSLSPHLPSYEEVRDFLRLTDGVPYNYFRMLVDGIRDAVGTPQDPTDWSKPDEWIPRRLEGRPQELALRLWQGSDRQMYLRHVYHTWGFAQRHELVERDEADHIVTTARGQRFIAAEKSVIASIDRYEGMLVVLAILETEGSARHQELTPTFGAFCRARTRSTSDSVIRSYLRARLNNMVARGLVAHLQPRFRLTAEGTAHLERHRGLVEPFESDSALDEEEHQPPTTHEKPAIHEDEGEKTTTQHISPAHEASVISSEPPSVAELFHRVESLLPAGEEVVTVSPEMIVSEALRLMKRNHLSHLPVMAGNTVLGVFSHRSFADRLMSLGDTPQFVGDWPVDEFMQPLRYHHRSDSWQAILDALEEQQAVLVGNPENLEGLITPMDTVNYLQQISSPFVMIAEIEQSLRRIIKARVEEEELPELVQRSLAGAYPEGQTPTDLSEMTFNDYKQLVTTRENWDYFAPVFGKSEWARKLANSRLIQIRQLRNDVFHFKRELTDNDRVRLAEFRNWLENKAKAYEAVKGG